MTPLQKSILNAVKRRPMTLRELQNNLQVDNSRLRTTVSAMVATAGFAIVLGLTLALCVFAAWVLHKKHML